MRRKNIRRMRARLVSGQMGTKSARAALTAMMKVSAVLLLGLSLFACSNASLDAARHEIAAGNYSAAHQRLSAVAEHSNSLSPRERREVMDGLCRTEYEIGAPAYTLSRQLRSCGEAFRQPDSRSRTIFFTLAARQRLALSAAVTTAIAQRDVARADDAILRYRALPQADPQMVARWTGQLWTLVNREEQPDTRRDAIVPAISELSRRFPHVQDMNKQRFRRWVEKNVTIGGTPMASSVAVGRRSIDLWIGGDQLAAAALHLDRFTRVNDGLIARCRCNGRTVVALSGSGLPAYLVRLDPQTRQSEVLILWQF